MDFGIGGLLTAGLFFYTLCFAASTFLIIFKKLIDRDRSSNSAVIYLNVYLLAAPGSWFLTQNLYGVLISLSIGIVISLISDRVLKNFSVSGRLLLSSNLLFTIFALLWGAWFITTVHLSTFTRILMLSGYPLLLFSLIVGLVSTFEQWEVLCRRVWLRARSPLPRGNLIRYPKVLLQLPAYSEPPEIVMSTINALANLRYPNFEVMVIDNNTKDPDLWKPVEKHCISLGNRFHFIHVDGIKGAKAGALNYALRHTPPDVEIIGVIDSDYHAERDFLDRLIGYFDDPKIGFVQTPHDYREWGNSIYQRMCYWEYKYFFETTMPSLNERDSALTVGTMCLIRRKALNEAGGWAEWCATEDSELSITIHALGYSSVYTNETFGRGLIPETFSGYKKQRFRWTYGPVQELRRHIRLYLPWNLRKPSALTTFQNIHHLNHGLGYLNIAMGFLLLPIGIAATISMIMHREFIEVPPIIWISSIVMLVSGAVLFLFSYRVLLKCSLLDTIGALLANRALSHTYVTASLWALITNQIPWSRTNKFKSLPLGLGALGSAQTELAVGIGMLTFAVAIISNYSHFGLHMLLMIGVLVRSIDYLVAPFMALLAEHDLRSRQKPTKFVKEIASSTAIKLRIEKIFKTIRMIIIAP
ncbi:MAG: glycosyltransferase [Deltaproteobacteria bacterium]|nr:glycosyltransferase [Deltaproteobacteria bacterium]